MPTPPLLALDTLDDRRELHRLLELLHPRRRVAFLRHCCETVKPKAKGLEPRPARAMRPRVDLAVRLGGEYDRRLATEIYLDLLGLAANYGLDLATAAVELESWVRRSAS